MNVLIIEDELLAQAKLESMLVGLDKSIVIQQKLGSVKDAVDWLSAHHPPDVAFVDIQLSDDHSFEIFKKVNVQFPVVFTTAYDKYLLQSFEFNSIDYLLKPISEEKLKRSLSKLKKLEQHFVRGNLEKLIHGVSNPRTPERMVVKKGTEFIALNMDEVAYFFTEHRIVFVRDFQGRQFITDKNLGELESSLNSQNFFRINRKYIANIRSIAKFKSDNGKIRIFLEPEMKEDIYVSKETAPEFRKWIGPD
jgi:DNA-binding LytR/AlgR family response regulator